MIYASKSSRMSSRVIKIDDQGGDNADCDDYDGGDNADGDNHDDGYNYDDGDNHDDGDNK